MTIVEDVPITPMKRYDFPEWPVGGSRFFETLAEVESCYSAAYSFEKNHQIGLKMSRRKEGEGYRLWRMA